MGKDRVIMVFNVYRNRKAIRGGKKGEGRGMEVGKDRVIMVFNVHRNRKAY